MSETTTKTPVLLIIFNRPEKVRLLLEALALTQPREIYIMADGPRDAIPTDIDLCQESRELALAIPWECNVHTHFLEKNLGCDQAVPLGIDWFFHNVDYGIILEDDCIPHESFFSFCTSLLSYHKDNHQVMHISGDNFQDDNIRGDGSYYYSLYSHSWGWATWKRAWSTFRPAVADMDSFVKENRIATLPLSSSAQKFWMKNYQTHQHWDALWQYAIWYSQGICIHPNTNLVSNIGHGTDATHTQKATKLSNLPTAALQPLEHPEKIEIDFEADQYTFTHIFYLPLWLRIYKRIRALTKHI